jgi:hypothetical protein
MTPHTLMHVQATREGVISRRTFLRTLGAGAALGTLGFKDTLTLHAQELQQRGMACILLFMNGGPSQFETFDPKPGHANGGPTQAIQTAVEGIRIAEGWTNTAGEMQHLAIVRSMTNREGEHQRAVYQMHTGYLPLAALRYPSIGSIVASEIGPRDFDLPSFVSIGNRLATIGSGFLGMAHAPFVVGDATRMPANVERPAGVPQTRFDRRLGLMQDLEADFAESGGQARVQEHRSVYAGASRLVRSPRLHAFELTQETRATRDRYGSSSFGQGCLLARRLVEAGVTFVEVNLGGWDTHQDNFTTTRRLSEQADAGLGALLHDLHERNRLDRTLVVWMGEFGRTPRINANTGRDHYPRAFSVAMAGAGIRGGRVLGATSEGGNDVTQRPVSVADLFCTFCHALHIDPRKENATPIGRPIRLVDGGAPVRELFS